MNEQQKQKYRDTILVAILLLPIVAYYYYVFGYTVNVPYSDDFAIALKGLNLYLDYNWWGRMQWIFEPHNEHRIVVTKLLVLFSYYTTGAVNFKFLVIIGNAALLGALWVFYKSAPFENNRLLYFIPSAFILFQLQHWENTGFPTASIQNFYVVVFGCGSLYLLSQRSTRSFIFALLVALMATYTSGNGLFVFVAGILILIQEFDLKKFSIWLTTGALFAYLYHHNLPQSASTQKPIEVVFQKTDKLVGGFFGLLGGSIDFDKQWEPVSRNFGITFFFGFALCCFFVHLLTTGYFKKRALLGSYLIFLFLTCAAIAFSRVELYTAYEMPTISRYKISSVALLVVAYLIAIDLTSLRFRKYLFAFLAVVFAVYCYAGFVKSRDVFKVHNDRLLASAWKVASQNDYSALIDWNVQLAEGYTKEAEKKGVFKMPDLTNRYVKNTWLSQPVKLDITDTTTDSSILMDFNVISTHEEDRWAIRNGWAFVHLKNSSGSQIFVVLKSAQDVVVMTTQPAYRGDVVEMHKKEHPEDESLYFDSGFTFSVNRKDLKPGIYQVGVLIVGADQKKSIRYSDKSITVH